MGTESTPVIRLRDLFIRQNLILDILVLGTVLELILFDLLRLLNQRVKSFDATWDPLTFINTWLLNILFFLRFSILFNRQFS